jgi:hypothetical protein
MTGISLTCKHQVLNFLNQTPRNKLVILKKESSSSEFLSIDLELAKALRNESFNSHFSMIAKGILMDLMNENLKSNEDFQNYFAICDIGFLLEKELKFDFTSFLSNQSQNHTLFLKWDGEIINNKLYFLTKQNGLEIDISSLSYIVI